MVFGKVFSTARVNSKTNTGQGLNSDEFAPGILMSSPEFECWSQFKETVEQTCEILASDWVGGVNSVCESQWQNPLVGGHVLIDEPLGKVVGGWTQTEIVIEADERGASMGLDVGNGLIVGSGYGPLGPWARTEVIEEERLRHTLWSSCELLSHGF